MGLIWANCFAGVDFAASGGRSEKLITLCGRQGISLYNVRPTTDGFTARLPARRYREVSRLARHCGTRLRVRERRGVLFRLRAYRGRWGLVLAPLVFAAAVHLLGQSVWSIRYDGLDAAARSRVEQMLYSMDICEGTVLTQEKLRLAEKQLMDGDEAFGWVSLNFEKGRLVVEASPALQKPAIESNDPVDLVAAADGILLEVNAQEGFAVKSVGQTVAAGDVLVSAYKPDPYEQPVESHAKGLVVAAVKKTYQCVQPSTYEVQALTGRVASSCRLRLFGHTLELGAQLPESEEVRTVHRPLTVLGFALPATIEERYVPQREARQFHLTPDGARQYARFACLAQLYAEFPDAEIIAESRQESWDGGTLTYTMTVDFKADIAREKGG